MGSLNKIKAKRASKWFYFKQSFGKKSSHYQKLKLNKSLWFCLHLIYLLRKSEINTITLVYSLKFCLINVGAQKINISIVQTLDIVFASF